jgi:hypothetical protein
LRNRATRRSTMFHRPISRPERKPGAGDVAGSTLTDTGEREMLDPMPVAVLALGGNLLALIIVGGFVGMILLAIYGYWKMRSDDFFEDRT